MATPAERLNFRTRTKAAIKRATFAAHREANRLDDRALAELDAMYRRAQAELQAAIVGYADEAGNLRLQVLQQLETQVNGIIERLGQRRDARLEPLLHDAADIALGSYGQVAGDAFLTRVSEEAVKFVYDFIDNKGLNLSARLWRLDEGARQAVGNAIKNAVIQGHGASEAVNNFLNRGEDVPASLLRQRDVANAAKVSRVAGDALMTGEGNPRANALRVFRTELNRAHGEAYMLGGEEHPDFGGWKFLLSPRHPAVDICDMHAKANLYGLGEGVYPDRERCPWPAHPNTLSYVVIVFADEITEEDRAGKTTRLDWLRDQPQDVQEAVLNSSKKAAALRAGILRENQIATPWRDLKPRYEKQGINVDTLGTTVDDAPAIIPRPAARGVPVSNALEPRQYHTIANEVLAAIDQVHGDGRLPQIPIIAVDGGPLAAYVSLLGTGRPLRIQVRRDTPIKHHALVHEVGHFIDHHGVRDGKFASETDKRWQPWRDAVMESAAVQRLQALVEGDELNALAARDEIRARIAGYDLDTSELWARSYAQYITLRSGNRHLVDQLDRMRLLQQSARLYVPTQWLDADFEPIAETIDALFKRLGWLHGET